jgi:hypothetical protein
MGIILILVRHETHPFSTDIFGTGTKIYRATDSIPVCDIPGGTITADIPGGTITVKMEAS